MNLLTDTWIPVRSKAGGQPQHISYAQLLCQPTQWLPCLPRDDMELALIQLLVSMTQVIFVPSDDAMLKQRYQVPLTEDEYRQGTQHWLDDFDLTHPQAPFMQVKGVAANEPTGMDKLLSGVTGATNCTFVNEPGQGEALCSGCAAIALFN